VTTLGADGIELEVGFWIRDPEEGTLAVRSEIARAVLRRFAAEGIQIPFPQREVRIVAGDAPAVAEAEKTKVA
jgi:small-conductance mechanosensitive channel